MIGKRLKKLKIIKITNKPIKTVNGIYKGGKYTRLNKNKELIIIPIPKLKSKDGNNTKIASKKRIFFKDLVFEPIARIIRKSFAFSIIPAF